MAAKIASALVLLVALSALVAGSPVQNAAFARVLFTRSCSSCDDASFCELGFPGTPEGHVACVVHNGHGARSLYRRYVTAEPACTDSQAVSWGATVQCATGSSIWRGCDTATGALAPTGATSSPGACYSGCCVPVAGLNLICGPKHQCVDGTSAALTITNGVKLSCDPSTGQKRVSVAATLTRPHGDGLPGWWAVLEACIGGWFVLFAATYSVLNLRGRGRVAPGPRSA
ncbi:hypothetical protein DFJ74DRAFT_752225 [Hyaloraphidium curvatum]|nr:hypothetical protein DFJ74DRAFT_752225 [Hyaloraphidium curvatum]